MQPTNAKKIRTLGNEAVKSGFWLPREVLQSILALAGPPAAARAACVSQDWYQAAQASEVGVRVPARRDREARLQEALLQAQDTTIHGAPGDRLEASLAAMQRHLLARPDGIDRLDLQHLGLNWGPRQAILTVSQRFAPSLRVLQLPFGQPLSSAEVAVIGTFAHLSHLRLTLAPNAESAGAWALASLPNLNTLHLGVGSGLPFLMDEMVASVDLKLSAVTSLRLISHQGSPTPGRPWGKLEAPQLRYLCVTDAYFTGYQVPSLSHLVVLSVQRVDQLVAAIGLPEGSRLDLLGITLSETVARALPLASLTGLSLINCRLQPNDPTASHCDWQWDMSALRARAVTFGDQWGADMSQESRWPIFSGPIGSRLSRPNFVGLSFTATTELHLQRATFARQPMAAGLLSGCQRLSLIDCGLTAADLRHLPWASLRDLDLSHNALGGGIAAYDFSGIARLNLASCALVPASAAMRLGVKSRLILDDNPGLTDAAIAHLDLDQVDLLSSRSNGQKAGRDDLANAMLRSERPVWLGAHWRETLGREVGGTQVRRPKLTHAVSAEMAGRALAVYAGSNNIYEGCLVASLIRRGLQDLPTTVALGELMVTPASAYLRCEQPTNVALSETNTYRGEGFAYILSYLTGSASKYGTLHPLLHVYKKRVSQAAVTAWGLSIMDTYDASLLDFAILSGNETLAADIESRLRTSPDLAVVAGRAAVLQRAEFYRTLNH